MMSSTFYIVIAAPITIVCFLYVCLSAQFHSYWSVWCRTVTKTLSRKMTEFLVFGELADIQEGIAVKRKGH